ncbi:Hypothetical predicted protein [Octopus vulgaris]|uniref:Uncharacterized protein n=1 Tax=Octopus vulgaris TaxID=6645 RepID=A0AA36AZ00_OCTVU|nr:Hypothetical predicted protein [Octopus vulgaris]
MKKKVGFTIRIDEIYASQTKKSQTYQIKFQLEFSINDDHIPFRGMEEKGHLHDKSPEKIKPYSPPYPPIPVITYESIF